MTKSERARTPYVRVAASGDHLTLDGRPWFYTADTIWSAFTHVPPREWRPYLEQRRRQGFNALQISVLPILHDMSQASGALPSPFPGFWSGSPAFGALDPAYAERARGLLAEARELGFVPVLVDLWCNYVEDTWASRDDPRFVIPREQLDAYLASVVAQFEEFSPIHVVSGDADFESETSIATYAHALRRLRELSPEALTAFHLQPQAQLPDALAKLPELDLYVYQSGHHVELDELPYALAARYRDRLPHRPVLNIEPPYEGHGHGFRYGRFGAADVRRATWQSLLAGASAGIAYGAHGVWQWHEDGSPFNHAEFSGMPFDRATALSFDGANDVTWCRHLFDERGLYGVAPRQDLLRDAPQEVRAAVSSDGTTVLVYAPWAIDLALEIAEQEGVLAERWNLGARRVERLLPSWQDGRLRVPMPTWIGDSLLVVRELAQL